MTTKTITPIDALVADAGVYLHNIATPAVKSSVADPGNPQKALAAFILLYHTKDWSKQVGVTENDYWSDCPFAQLMSEVANGGKHQEVTDKQLTRAPVVVEFRRCGYGEGGYGIGPYGVENIQVCARSPTGDSQWLGLETVLDAVLNWWTDKIEPKRAPTTSK